MAEVLELEKPQDTIVVVNPELSKHKDRVASKKLEEANEMLKKHPVPAWIFLSRYSKEQQEQGVFMSGVLKYADIDTFSLAKMNTSYESLFEIRTTPEMLNKIVKNYWGETINVHIRPQISKDNQFEYELIAVK